MEELERALGEEVEVSKAILEKLPEGAVVRSPGMKYKHYAPKADVTLLEGSFEQFKAYVDAHADQNPSCLCFTGEAEKLGVPCVCLLYTSSCKPPERDKNMAVTNDSDIWPCSWRLDAELVCMEYSTSLEFQRLPPQKAAPLL